MKNNKYMKKYNDFINEKLFGKNDGDDFTEKLLDIIKNENIKVSYDNSMHAKHARFDGSYNVNVDGIDYYFIQSSSIGSITNYYILFNDEKMKISRFLFKKLQNIYKEQKSKIELPDLSDLGRASKKYNL